MTEPDKAELEHELARIVPLAVEGDERALGRVIKLIHPPVLRYTRARIGVVLTPTA